MYCIRRGVLHVAQRVEFRTSFLVLFSFPFFYLPPSLDTVKPWRAPGAGTKFGTAKSSKNQNGICRSFIRTRETAIKRYWNQRSKDVFSKGNWIVGGGGLTLFCAKRSKDQLNPQCPSTWCSFISVYRFSLNGPDPLDLLRPRDSVLHGVAGKVSFTKDATTRWWYIYGFRDRAGTRGGSWEPLFSGAPTPDERRKRRSQEGRGGTRRCRGFFSYAILLVLLHPWKWIVNDGSYLNQSFSTFSPRFSPISASHEGGCKWEIIDRNRDSTLFFTRRYFDTKWTFMQYPCFYIHVKTRGRGKNIFESFIIKLMPTVDGLRECQEFLEEYVLEISSLLFLSRESLIW